MLKRFLQLPVIIGDLPFVLTNGTIANADEVMADFDFIVSQVNTNAANTSGSEWTPFSGSFFFINATSFSMTGDQSAIFQVGRRLKMTVTAGILYGTIVTVTVVGNTTVQVSLDSGSLDVGLSAVSYGLLAANPLSRPKMTMNTMFFNHNTDVLSSGANQIIKNTNGFVGGFNPADYYGEFSIPAGTYTPFRTGFYLMQWQASYLTNGVTFTAATQQVLSLLDNGSPIGTAYPYATMLTGANAQAIAFGQNMVAAVAGHAFSLQLQPGSWSAGTPVFNGSLFGIMGPF